MSQGVTEAMDGETSSAQLTTHQHTKLDAFICGLCDSPYNEFREFLQHKVTHDNWSGIYLCFFCKTKENSEESIHNHYLYFHNIQTLTSEIVAEGQMRNTVGLSSKQQGRDGKISTEGIGIDERDMGVAGHMILAACESEGVFDRSASKVGPFDPRDSDTRDIQLCSKENHSERSQSLDQHYSDEMMEELQSVRSVLMTNNNRSIAEDGDASQQSSLYPQFTESKDEDGSKHVQPSSDCTCKSTKSDLSKRTGVLSPATLSQIKRFASTAVSSSSTTSDGHKKVIIICSQGISGKFERKVTSTQKDPQDMLNLESEKDLSSEKDSVITMEDLAQKFPPFVDRTIDVTKYERDFLFQVGMKESSGKNMKYLREVYICLYCEAFEKHCLDRLIVHMMESHQSAIMERCPMEKAESVRMKTVSGVMEPSITSFQEYRSKLLDRKMEEEERRSQRMKEKSHSGSRINLPCMYCSKQFATHRKLQAHTDKHLNIKRFLCEECGRSFRSWHLLWSHKKEHLNASYGKIKCSLCSFQSGDTQALNRHYRIHPKQSHLCHICGNMYSSLRKHVKVHSLERPYPCPFKGCTFRFTSEVPCKIHYQAHTAQGQRFACSKCSHRFPRKHQLLRHQVKVHGDSIEGQESTCNNFTESLRSSFPETFHMDQDEETAVTSAAEEFHVVDEQHLDMVEELHS